MIILPAIDLRAGKCVRLHQGDYNQETIYGDDPVAVAQSFKDAGAEWIHVVDLDGAKSGKPEHLEIIKGICQLGLRVENGGGVRSIETIETLLRAGVERVILGSALIKNEGFAKQAFSEFPGRLIAGLDVRNEQIAISGWLEQTALNLYETAAEMIELGADRFIVTDIATDGTLMGPNLQIAAEFLKRFSADYVVSGGIGSSKDIDQCAALSPFGVITGKAIYDGRLDLSQVLRKYSIPEKT